MKAIDFCNKTATREHQYCANLAAGQAKRTPSTTPH